MFFAAKIIKKTTKCTNMRNNFCLVGASGTYLRLVHIGLFNKKKSGLQPDFTFYFSFQVKDYAFYRDVP
ncbi:hypothetical protein BSYN_17720 [Bacteroides sedimenti]|uniref:Uncharacterized protein n=1 Tax=Bacteroides sedimenti TaxID=2136147 RepID=A0ABM8IGS3_9BACE